jgi:hypothetical protein
MKYDFALMQDPEQEIEEGKIYLNQNYSSLPDGGLRRNIAYQLKISGKILDGVIWIEPPSPFTLEKLQELEVDILNEINFCNELSQTYRDEVYFNDCLRWKEVAREILNISSTGAIDEKNLVKFTLFCQLTLFHTLKLDQIIGVNLDKYIALLCDTYLRADKLTLPEKGLDAIDNPTIDARLDGFIRHLSCHLTILRGTPLLFKAGFITAFTRDASDAVIREVWNALNKERIIVRMSNTELGSIAIHSHHKKVDSNNVVTQHSIGGRLFNASNFDSVNYEIYYSSCNDTKFKKIQIPVITGKNLIKFLSKIERDPKTSMYSTIDFSDQKEVVQERSATAIAYRDMIKMPRFDSNAIYKNKALAINTMPTLEIEPAASNSCRVKIEEGNSLSYLLEQLKTFFSNDNLIENTNNLNLSRVRFFSEEKAPIDGLETRSNLFSGV